MMTMSDYETMQLPSLLPGAVMGYLVVHLLSRWCKTLIVRRLEQRFYARAQQVATQEPPDPRPLRLYPLPYSLALRVVITIGMIALLSQQPIAADARFLSLPLLCLACLGFLGVFVLHLRPNVRRSQEYELLAVALGLFWSFAVLQRCNLETAAVDAAADCYNQHPAELFQFLDAPARPPPRWRSPDEVERQLAGPLRTWVRLSSQGELVMELIVVGLLGSILGGTARVARWLRQRRACPAGPSRMCRRTYRVLSATGVYFLALGACLLLLAVIDDATEIHPRTDLMGCLPPLGGPEGAGALVDLWAWTRQSLPLPMLRLILLFYPILEVYVLVRFVVGQAMAMAPIVYLRSSKDPEAAAKVFGRITSRIAARFAPLIALVDPREQLWREARFDRGKPSTSLVDRSPRPYRARDAGDDP